MKNCPESYNGATGRSPIERSNEHSGEDINLHMFKHSIEVNYPTVTIEISQFLALATATEGIRGKYQDLYLPYLADLR